MATDELDLHNLEAFNEDLANEPEAQADVTDEGETQVADEADVQPSADDSADETDVAKEAGPVSQDDFRRWQSKYDKNMDVLKKENEALKDAQSRPPSGPSPQELGRFNDLKRQFEYATSMAENGTNEEERSSGNYQAGLLRSQLMQAESTIAAREAGIEPNTPQYLEELANADIQTSGDIYKIAWQVRATSTPGHEQSNVLEAKAKEVEKNQMSLDEQVKAEVAKQMAALRQSQGLNATAGTKPGGVPGGKTAVIKAYQRAKAAGDIDAVLNMKTQYDYLG